MQRGLCNDTIALLLLSASIDIGWSTCPPALEAMKAFRYSSMIRNVVAAWMHPNATLVTIKHSLAVIIFGAAYTVYCPILCTTCSPTGVFLSATNSCTLTEKMKGWHVRVLIWDSAKQAESPDVLWTKHILEKVLRQKDELCQQSGHYYHANALD